MVKVGLICIVKQEELYIREWIQYYKDIVKIDKIFLIDNNDSSYDIQLPSIIQDYIDDGYVEITDRRDMHDGKQSRRYNEVYQRIKNDFDYICIFDCDEFLNLECFNDIHDMVTRDTYKGFDIISIPWRMFGDNEQLYYEDRPVRERFISPTFLRRVSCKNIYKTANITLINGTHELKEEHYKRCFPDGTEKTKISKFIFEPDKFYSICSIDHYFTKSTEEYIKFKILRGRVSKAADDPRNNIRYTIDKYFSVSVKTKEKMEMFKKYNIK